MSGIASNNAKGAEHDALNQPTGPAGLLEYPDSPTKESVRWTPEEDEMLRAAVALYKGKNWKKISDCFGTKKTEVQCLQHWRNVLNPCVVKGKGSWTPEEDHKLQMLVQKYGKTKWSYIGKFLPGRIGKQCRERWHNHLNPDLTKKQWTQEEETLIIEQRAKLGNRWAKIARMLPGRSDNDVKNRWYASLRKKVEGGGGVDKKGKDGAHIDHFGVSSVPYSKWEEGWAVRGILCFDCNKYLGSHDTDFFEEIIRYLENPPAQSFEKKRGQT